MDISILGFLVATSFVLFSMGFVIGMWVKLALGWIAGAILIVVGLTIGNGENITSTVVFDASDIVTTSLDLGISSENFMIIFISAGLVMVVIATFMDR